MAWSSQRSWQAQLVPTGVPNLDRLLGGGLTRGSLTLLAGGPGTGKTVLAEQMAFHWAAQGLNVLWLVMLGEPNEKFLVHLSQMAFYDRRQIGAGIQLINLTRYLRQGFEDKLAAIRETIRSGAYSFVVIDGFQGLRGFMADEREVRLFLSELSSELALMGISLIVTADTVPSDVASDPALAIADAIIVLSQALQSGKAHREIQVPKLRGRGAIAGAHTFTIDSAGLHVYPRLETIATFDTSAMPAIIERRAFGVPGLDRLLSGGVLKGSTTLVVGGPGTGKSLLAAHFLAADEREGEQSFLMCSLEESTRLLARADAFGLPLRAAFAAGRLTMVPYDPAASDPDIYAGRILDTIAERRVCRLVLENIDALECLLSPSGRTLDYLAALFRYLQGQQVTTLCTFEAPALPNLSASALPPIAAQVADNLILLRLVQVNGRLRRLLEVAKTRHSYHSTVVAEMLLEEGRLSVVAQPRIKEPEPKGETMYGVPPLQHEGERLRAP